VVNSNFSKLVLKKKLKSFIIDKDHAGDDPLDDHVIFEPTVVIFHPCNNNVFIIGLESGHLQYLINGNYPFIIPLIDHPITNLHAFATSQHSSKLYIATANSEVLLCKDDVGILPTPKRLPKTKPKKPGFEILAKVTISENPQKTKIDSPSNREYLLIWQPSQLQIRKEINLDNVSHIWCPPRNSIISSACCAPDGQHNYAVCTNTIQVFSNQLHLLHTIVIGQPLCYIVHNPVKAHQLMVAAEDGTIMALELIQF